MNNWNDSDQKECYERLLSDIDYYENGYRLLEEKYETYSYEAVHEIFSQITSILDKDGLIIMLNYTKSIYDYNTEYKNNQIQEPTSLYQKAVIFFQKSKIALTNCFYTAGSYLPNCIRRSILNFDFLTNELCTRIDMIEENGISQMLDTIIFAYFPGYSISTARYIVNVLCSLKKYPVKTTTVLIHKYLKKGIKEREKERLKEEKEEKEIKEKEISKIKDFNKEKNDLNKALKELIAERQSTSTPEYKDQIDLRIKKIQYRLANYISIDTSYTEELIAKSKIMYLQRIEHSCEWDFDRMQEEINKSGDIIYLKKDEQGKTWGETLRSFIQQGIVNLSEYFPIPTKPIKQIVDKIPIIRDSSDTKSQIATLGLMMSILAGPLYLKRKALYLRYKSMSRFGWTVPGRPPVDVSFPTPTIYKTIPAGLIGLFACSNMIERSYKDFLKMQPENQIRNTINLDEMDLISIEEEKKEIKL